MGNYIDDESIGQEITPEQITYIFVNNALHKVVSKELNNSKAQIEMLANESQNIETGVYQNNVVSITLGAFGLGTLACATVGYLFSPTIALGGSAICCAVVSGLIANAVKVNRKMLKVNTGLHMMLAEEQEKYDAEKDRLIAEINDRERDMSYN